MICGVHNGGVANPTLLRVVVLDPTLDEWASQRGRGGRPSALPRRRKLWARRAPPGPHAFSWPSILGAAGVPHRVVTDPAADDGGGLLILPDPDAAPDAAARALELQRPLLTGPPPPRPSQALACVRDALGALARPDLRGVMLLRLDDPGGASGTYLRGWAHPPVPGPTWDALWARVKEFGRLSVFCSAGWVTEDGQVVPSRDARPELWAALDDGVSAGVADLECHGYTHLHPDTTAWAAAPDRFDSDSWYREMWPPLDPVEPAVESQEAIIAAWQAACGAGTTLVAPGEAWGPNTVQAARHRGLELFNSWGVCRLQLAVPTWSAGISSYDLCAAPTGAFADGLPQVAYWHDRDLALEGPTWFAEQLGAWRDVGATRGWAFADLARAYRVPIDAALVDGDVVVRSGPDVPLLIEAR